VGLVEVLLEAFNGSGGFEAHSTIRRVNGQPNERCDCRGSEVEERVQRVRIVIGLRVVVVRDGKANHDGVLSGKRMKMVVVRGRE
jgi:hypothetical protein